MRVCASRVLRALSNLATTGVVCSLALALLSVAGVAFAQELAALPPGTPLQVKLSEALSSNGSKTGQVFAFTMATPVTVEGRVVVEAGAKGKGTVVLAGHAGGSGHEGDLKLRFNSVSAAGGGMLPLAADFTTEGHKRKTAALLSGFIPFVGMGAPYLIRGDDIEIKAGTVLKVSTPTVAVSPAAHADASAATDQPLAASPTDKP